MKLAALEALRNNGQENAEKPLQEFISNEQDKELLQNANGVYDDPWIVEFPGNGREIEPPPPPIARP